MEYYVRHILGFLLQIAPPMILCLIPFDKATFKYPKKRVIIIYSILCLIVSIIFPFFRNLIVFLPIEQPTVLSNLYMLIVLIGFIVFYFLIIYTQKIKKVFVLLLVFFYATTQYLIVNLFSPLFPKGELPDAYPLLTLGLYALTTLIMFPLYLWLMKKIVAQYLIKVDTKYIKREFVMTSIVTFLYIALLVIYSSRPDTEIGDFWWWIAPTFILIAIILFMFYLNLLSESVRRSQDSEKSKTLEIQKIQYEKTVQEIENVYRIKHDMRHHFSVLSQMLSQNNINEMNTYLNNLTDTFAKMDNKIYCHNVTINSLLQYYIDMAQNKKIRCEIQANCNEISITPVDLTVIIGNIMENAIRAASNIKDNPFILVQIDVVGMSLIIQIINSCDKVSINTGYDNNSDFLPASAFKSTRLGGGYGLKSIDDTTKKYCGSSSFCFDDNNKTFTTRVRLNLNNDDKN